MEAGKLSAETKVTQAKAESKTGGNEAASHSEAGAEEVGGKMAPQEIGDPASSREGAGKTESANQKTLKFRAKEVGKNMAPGKTEAGNVSAYDPEAEASEVGKGMAPQKIEDPKNKGEGAGTAEVENKLPQRFRADDSWILREEAVGQSEPEKFNLFQEPEEFAMNDGNSTDGSMPGEGDDAGCEGLPPASPQRNSLKKQAHNVVGGTQHASIILFCFVFVLFCARPVFLLTQRNRARARIRSPSQTLPCGVLRIIQIIFLLLLVLLLWLLLQLSFSRCCCSCCCCCCC